MNFVFARMRTFFAPSMAKMIVWGIWLALYLGMLIFRSPSFPKPWRFQIEKVVYKASVFANPNRVRFSPKAIKEEKTDTLLIVTAYILDSYGLACLFVETSGRIRNSPVWRKAFSRSIGKKQKRKSHA